MFGGYLTESTFLTLVCQKSVQGREVDARWVAQLFGITKSTALHHLAKLVDDDVLLKKVVPWRENSKKFFFRPSPGTLEKYRKMQYRAEYLRYMQEMMKS